MHEDVALEFARWLSPAFAIWCNDRIKELLKTGVTTASNEDEAIAYAMQVLNRRLEQAKAEKKQLEQQNAKLQPKAAFADAAFATDDKVDIGMSAKILKLGFGRNTLFDKLRKAGVFFANRNEPKQRFIDAGYFEMKEKFIERNNHPVCRNQSASYPKGIGLSEPPVWRKAFRREASQDSITHITHLQQSVSMPDSHNYIEKLNESHESH